MQVNHATSPKPIRVIPPEQWTTLPIQPTAGYWWRIARRLTWALLVAFGALAGVAIASVSDRRFAAFAPPVNMLVAALALATVVVCIVAARPYRRERKLGYTTWPSIKELKNLS
jgi:cytochrome bd-type quinol oxidase subunit 2